MGLKKIGIIKDRLQEIEYPVPFVMDANWVNGLGVIQSLGRVGLQCVAINYAHTGVGLYSKHAMGLVGPDPWIDPQGLIALLVDLGESLTQKGVLFVTDDKYLEVLSAAKKELEPYYLFSFPDIDVLRRLLDKNEQYCAAEKAGLSHPRSMAVKSAADLERWGKDIFPTVIKGVSGKDFFHHFGRQAVEAGSFDEANETISNGKGIEFLFQEIIPGGEENLYTLGCYMNPRGEVIGTFTGRKLRQYPRYYGTCTVGESAACDDLIEPALDTLRSLDFYGIAQVECKRDARDGKLKLIEINGRFWKWHSLAAASGINLAACAYKDITGWGEYAPTVQRYGKKWVVLIEDLRGVGKDIANQEFHLIIWLRNLTPPIMSGLFDWKDMKPFMMKIIFMIGKIFGSGA